MTNKNTKLTASVRKAPRADLSAYTPTFLNHTEWAKWRPTVISTVMSLCTNSSMARGLAGDICELIQLTKPEHRDDLSEVINDRSIRILLDRRKTRGLNEKSIEATRQRLQLIHTKRAAKKSIKPGAKDQAARQFARFGALEEIIVCGDEWMASRARLLRDHLLSEKWDRPLPHDEYLEFISQATKLGHECNWRWRDMKIEAVRHILSKNESLAFLIKSYQLLPAQLVSATVGAPDVQASTCLRGQGILTNPSKGWRIVRELEQEQDPRPKQIRVSKSAAKRLAAQALAEHAKQAKPLPNHLERLLLTWKPQPRVLNIRKWEEAKPLTMELMRRSHIRGEESFKKHLRLVSRYVAWCIDRGYEMDVDTLCDNRAIERFTQEVLLVREAKSANTLRSQLRAIASKASISPDAPVQRLEIPKWKVRSPYTPSEVERILKRLELEKNPRTKARLQTLIALGLGAGLDTRDLTEMTKAHVIDHESSGIELHIPGERPRTVWLRYEYEELLRRGIAPLGREEHILRSPNMHKDTVRDLLKLIDGLGDENSIQQGRLRNTWIATLLIEPISIWTILQAAGLQGARTLADIATYLQPAADLVEVRGAK